mgnify:CR=1 FL=1
MNKASLSNSPEPHGIEAIVCQDIAKRQATGMNKYGISVADNPLLLKAWVQHLYEELLDASIYAKRILAELEKENDI